MNKSYLEILLSVLNLMLTLVIIYLAQIVVDTNFDDNENYRAGYENVINESFSNAFDIYKEKTAASEPVLFFYSYIAAPYVSYDALMLLINFKFLLLFYLVLKKFYSKNYRIIYFFFVITSAYLFVLLSNVHRLKLALLVWFVYLLVNNKYKIPVLVLSIASHFQILVFALINILSKFTLKGIVSRAISFFNFKYLLFYFAAYFVLLYDSFGIFEYIRVNIESKLLYYYEDRKVSNYFTMFVVMSIYGHYLLYLFCFRLKKTFVELYKPIIIVMLISLILGFYRINLLVFGYLYIAELNKFLGGVRHAILPVIGFLIYNVYQLICFWVDVL
jgi:hypothetical protein